MRAMKRWTRDLFLSFSLSLFLSFSLSLFLSFSLSLFLSYQSASSRALGTTTAGKETETDPVVLFLSLRSCEHFGKRVNE